MEAIAIEKPYQPKQSTDLAQMVRDGKSDQQIREVLVAVHGEGANVDELMAEVKKLRASKNAAAGLTFILIGSLVLLASFVIAFMHFNTNQSMSFALYGLTTIGILIVFVGLMKIFG